MIDKVEAGCTYRLIDKEVYFNTYEDNKKFYKKYFVNDCIKIDRLGGCETIGYVDGEDTSIIHSNEYHLFEKVDPITTRTTEIKEASTEVGEDLSEKQTALQTQVGGTHYTDMQMQPIELAYLLNATPCFTKVAKYCSRKKDNMIQQTDKAIHCVKLEASLRQGDSYPKKSSKEVLYTVAEFTDNVKLACALSSMYFGAYQLAETSLEMLKEDILSKEEKGEG